MKKKVIDRIERQPCVHRTCERNKNQPKDEARKLVKISQKGGWMKWMRWTYLKMIEKIE